MKQPDVVVEVQTTGMGKGNKLMVKSLKIDGKELTFARSCSIYMSAQDAVSVTVEFLPTEIIFL